MAKRNKKQQIDADTWAQSGGTNGIFGALWRKGLLEIVDSFEPIIPNLKK